MSTGLLNITFFSLPCLLSCVLRAIICVPLLLWVANAVGAALSKVSGTFGHVVPLKNTTREKAWEEAKRGARRRAVEAEADERTLEVIDKDDVPLAYLPGNVENLIVKLNLSSWSIHNYNKP